MLTTLSQSGPRSDNNELGTSHYPKFQDYQILTIRLFNVICRTLFGEILPPSTKMISEYFTAPVDWPSFLHVDASCIWRSWDEDSAFYIRKNIFWEEQNDGLDLNIAMTHDTTEKFEYQFTQHFRHVRM